MTARRSNRSSVEPLAQGLDDLQLVADGLAIAGLHALDESLQVLADVARDRVASFAGRPRGRRSLPAVPRVAHRHRPDSVRFGSSGSRRSTRTSCCHESPKSYS